MENEQKIGKGIKIMSIIFIVFSIISIASLVYSVLNYDNTVKVMEELGNKNLIPSITDYYVSLVATVLSLVCIVLIMKKNKIGVFSYFGIYILGQIYSLVSTNMMGKFYIVMLVVNFLIQCLYAYFIYKKRDLYGITVK